MKHIGKLRAKITRLLLIYILGSKTEYEIKKQKVSIDTYVHDIAGNVTSESSSLSKYRHYAIKISQYGVSLGQIWIVEKSDNLFCGNYLNIN